MKKMLWSFGLLGTIALAPSPVMALDTGATYHVSLVDGSDEQSVGTWEFSTRGSSGGDCRFTLHWNNGRDRTAECQLTQERSGDSGSCDSTSGETSRRTIRNESGRDCDGFNRDREAQGVDEMVLHQHESGRLTGTIMFSGSGSVFGIEANKR